MVCGGGGAEQAVLKILQTNFWQNLRNTKERKKIWTMYMPALTTIESEYDLTALFPGNVFLKYL